MSRLTIAPRWAAALALTLFINVLLGFFFAACGKIDLQDPLPPYAIRPTPMLLATLYSPASQPIPLIHLAFRRPDTDTLANALLGFLVWLPATVSVMSVILQYHRIARVRVSDTVRRGTAIVSVVLFGIALCWAVIDNGFLNIVFVVLAASVLLAIAMWRDAMPDRRVLISALLFMVTGVSASITSHTLYTTYHGLVPVPFSDQQAEQRLLTDLNRDINTMPRVTNDEIFDRIERLPSMNAWGPAGIAIFAKNRFATKALVISALLYTVVFACALRTIKLRYYVSATFLIAYALCMYAATGAAFGLLYFNDVLSDAGRQNVLCVLAQGATAPDPQFKVLKEQFARFGWSRKLEKSLDELHHKTDSASKVLSAALAERWANNVIAQQRPQNPPEHIANQTLADMFYFSFVSFTTTGYGDLRPVSDSARMWAIIENVAELIFTAIFFVLALSDARPPEGSCPQSPPASGGRQVSTRLIVSAIALMFLAKCTSLGESPAAEFPSSPESLCRIRTVSTRTPVLVVVDDSQSMLGFFDAPDPSYAKSVHDMLYRLLSNSEPTYRRLSDPRDEVRLERVCERGFYSRPDTPLTSLFRFAENVDSHEPIIFITDLQQDEAAGVELLNKAIKRALRQRPYVSLYGWKAKYRHKEEVDGRPWYALILSESAEGLAFSERASDVLATNFKGTPEEITEDRAKGPFIFQSRSFAWLESLEWVVDEPEDREWQPDTATPRWHKCNVSNQTVLYSAFVRRAAGDGALRFQGVLKTEIQLEDVEQLKCKFRRPDATNSASCAGYVTLRRIPADIASTNPPSRVQSIPLEISYSLPIKGPWTSYIVELEAGQLNLKCPQWIIDDWSTASAHDWKKTLNLQEIVQTFIATSSENEPILLHYLILKRNPA